MWYYNGLQNRRIGFESLRACYLKCGGSSSSPRLRFDHLGSEVNGSLKYTDYIFGWKVRLLIQDESIRESNPAAKVAVCKTVTKKHRRFESYLSHGTDKLNQMSQSIVDIALCELIPVLVQFLRFCLWSWQIMSLWIYTKSPVGEIYFKWGKIIDKY